MEHLAADVRLTKRSHERRIGIGCRQAENGGNRGMANPDNPGVVSPTSLGPTIPPTSAWRTGNDDYSDGHRDNLVGLSLVVLPARAEPNQPASAKPDGGEFAALERPVAFEISPSTGTLKETAQRGQELIWIRKDNPSERRFQVTNISVGFLRSEVGGQVQMTFSANATSLGYSTSEEAKLNVIMRTPGGASLHSWSLRFSVQCGDNNQPLTPITHDVPRDLTAGLFRNVGAVEIAELSEANFSGVKVQPCS